jgi:hypothetical protein
MVASDTKNIQQRYRHGKSDDGWVDSLDPEWDWDSFDYRIAPELMQVEVWVHPSGMICDYMQIGDDYAKREGFIRRRATIHPEEVKP